MKTKTKLHERLRKKQQDKTRIIQGWQYGAERNDTLKHHPCLAPMEICPIQKKNMFATPQLVH